MFSLLRLCFVFYGEIGKISAQPHTTLCIQFLDRENQDKDNTLPLGKHNCFTIIRACAEILLRNLSWLRMGSCVHFCCCNILFLRTMCGEGSPWSMLWRVKFAYSPIIIASKTMSCSKLIGHDNLAHPLAYMLSAFLYLFWFKNQEKNWLALQWLKLLEFKPFWCKLIEN